MRPLFRGFVIVTNRVRPFGIPLDANDFSAGLPVGCWSVRSGFPAQLVEIELAKSIFEFFSLACVGAFCSSLLQSIIDGASGSFEEVGQLRRILLAECGAKVDRPVAGHGEDARSLLSPGSPGPSATVLIRPCVRLRFAIVANRARPPASTQPLDRFCCYR